MTLYSLKIGQKLWFLVQDLDLIRLVLCSNVPEYPVAKYWAPFVQKFNLDLNNSHAKFGAWPISGDTFY